MIKLTSLATPQYNCIAWAAEDTGHFWWPDRMQLGYWPPGVARETTLDAFVAAYRTLGYEPCGDGEFDLGYQKVAIYCRLGKPTHAARQLPTGEWTSKLGKAVDISHDTPAEVLQHPGCSSYGLPTLFLRRPARGITP
jgi:hypothetical protein